MTEQEKAEELINRYLEILAGGMYDVREEAKKCALVCVYECIKEHCHESEHKDPLAQDRWIDYWQEVKKEISLLQLTTNKHS